MSSPLNIAIIGASGTIGQIILNALTSRPEFALTVLSRQESSDKPFPAGITVQKTDFSPASLEKILQGQDVVISAVGATAFTEQKKFIDAAIRGGVKRFFPSEFSASSQDEAVLRLLPLFRQKADIIEYLKSKEGEGLSWTGIATSGLFDWGLKTGFLGFDLKNHTATIWDGGVRPFTLTNENQLGNAVVAALLRPDETKDQVLHIASVETTQEEILSTLEDVTGVRWNVTATTTDFQVEDGGRKLGAGDFSGAFQLVRATAFGNIPDLKPNYVKDWGLANGTLELELESVRETVVRVAQA
ncbi:NmrA-like family protein [Aspergillus ellipticus CBS 707.79]|uniref:NmrA-like family protein n=1 Tax=Aspergillus ellipticus CBS 707.79 TaxID=1448320 RepID=A0A319DDN7_9EURO|nr:NmrA-like family protein [Aspergillus ellipticus CBS 707.79]